ncbi:MAG TPA: ribonuclease J, partial [Mycobacteriales bacterium]
FRVINGLARWGATVVHKSTALVHVSGHAPAGELLYVLNAVRPTNLMPVHGEWRHLRAHAELAKLSGLAADRIVIAEDGVVVDLVDGLAKISGAVECGYVYVDGLAVGDVTEVSLKDRRILGDEGIVTITIVVDAGSGKIVGGPEIHARGVSDEPGAFDDAARLAAEAVESALLEGVTDRTALQQRVRRVVGRWVSDTYRRRPMIAPIVLEV